MENASPNIQNPAPMQENPAGGSTFDFKKLLKAFASGWYWFVISVVICLFIAALHILRTTPQYTRTATLLIKETNGRRSSATDIEALLSNAGQMTSRVSNEVVVFQAPILMEEAVHRLGLTTRYSLKGRFRNSVAYASQVPVNAAFLSDVPEDCSVSLRIDPVPGDSLVEVSHISYTVSGQRGRFKVKGKQTVALGDTLVLPFGSVILSKNPYFYSGRAWNRTEFVTKSSLSSTSRMFSAKLTASAADVKKLSDVMTLTMVDASPRRADDVLNMLITVYNENWVKDMNQMAVSTSFFINDRLTAVEDELSKVDKDISNYKTKNKMPSVDASSTMYMTATTDIARQIRELENELSVTKYLRNYMNTTLNATDLIPLPAGITNSGLVNQVNEYNDMLLKRNNLVASSSERNPLVVDIDQALSAMRSAIVSSVETQVASLEEQLSYARSQEEKASDQLAQSPTQAKDLLVYERRQKVQENLYLYLLQKREENALSQAFTAYNTRVINPPYGPVGPTAPKKKQILLIAFLLGLLIPAGVIYLLMISDNKVRNRRDLEGVKAPFLGEIPISESAAESTPKWKILHFVKPTAEDKGNELVVKAGSRDLINEAFRVLRTNIEFVSKGTEHSVIMVTSFNPGSGKTFITINAAAVLALKGKKVLVIDADFRRASFSHFFGLKGKGLADCLADPSSNDIASCIVKDLRFKELDVLPVGTIPPNPSELVSQPLFSQTVENLKQSYDYVLLDCAPVDIVADTQIISPIADRTIFIVRAGLFDKRLLGELNDIYTDGKYNNVSLVLNGTEIRNSYYHTRYSSGYAYHKGAYGYGHHYGYYSYSSSDKEENK